MHRLPMTMQIQIILWLLVMVHNLNAKSTPIAAALSAKWQYTPIVFEASEYMASEGDLYYWNFIDTVIQDGGLLSDREVTQEMIHNFAVATAQNVLKVEQSSNKLKLLKFSLSIHEYSPRVEMFHQIALDKNPPSCSLFYQVGNEVTCTLEETSEMLKNNVPTPIFSHDHIYPQKHAPENATIIVYGDFTSVAFRDIHYKFKMAAESGVYRYVYRPYIRSRPEGKVWLSGYGVELALKSTEYKAVDDSEVKDSGSAEEEAGKDVEIDGFDFATLRTNNPDLGEQLTKFRNALSESSNEMTPLKKWQLQDLSYQAASRILSQPSHQQLDALIDISQNFPQRARSLVRQEIPENMKTEVKHNQKHALMSLDIEQGNAMLLLNGINVDLDTADVFMLLDMLRDESWTMDAISKLKFDGDDVHTLTRLEVTSQPQEYKLDIRDKSIVWMNDIENDARYKSYPPSLHELLRPAFPGTVRRVRRNLFHLVFVMDPALPEVAHLMKTAEILWANDIPVRIGISFVVNDARPLDSREDAGVAVLRAYNFALQETSAPKAFQFLVGIYKALDMDDPLTADHVISEFSKEFKNEDIELIFGPDSDYDVYRTRGLDYFKRSGLNEKINVLFNGALMSEQETGEDDFQDAVIDRLLEATRPLQRAVYMGELHNSMNILDTLMGMPGVVPRFNDMILKQKPVFIDMLGKPTQEKKFIQTDVFKNLDNPVKTATMEQYLKKFYLAKTDKAVTRPLTLWVVADVDTVSGRALIYNSMKYLKSSGHARVQFVHNSKDEYHVSDFANAIESVTASQTINNARNFITKLMKEENAAAIISGEKKISDFYVGGMDVDKFEEIYKHKYAVHHLFSEREWCMLVLAIQPGQSAVVANGRVVGPLSEDDILTVDDFNLLESVMKSAITSKLQDAFKELNNPPKSTSDESDMIMKLTSVLFHNKNSDLQRVDVPSFQSEHSVVTIPPKHDDQPAFDIVAVLDPASEEAQKISPLVKVLSEIVNCNIRVLMNCREKLSDLPVKRFYRYVLQPTMDFTNIYARWNGPVARFHDMPRKALLTLMLHAPEGWLVEATEAVYDLDNIKLDNVKSSVTAGFELECMLLEGHTTDIQAGNHPRGLQFVLGTNTNPNTVDTIVMSNLGYFQMKANPGAWTLKLREGRSKEIYEIVGHSSPDSPNESGDITIIMDSFQSKIVTVKVAKQADKQHMNLLVEDEKEGDEEDSSIWNSIKSTWSGSSSEGKKTIEKDSEEDVINIFSLASGHLYERLMRIMFVSVMRKTDAKVKFWILKNYLSPQFKNVIPKMAEEYGFDYELVQYKWPRWLNQQKEKQRTMWGYKILFLDVLFPLNVDKIIFVDADQIVRTDLRELRDLDLEGNPYGYTPFCNDKKEMDGFRFWNQGYWRNHLAGRRYHISAIYVVDLKAFRALAAGDRLRGQYQGLSQDPNSLANLDQDLPNNMIHQVGIKSLPQEWLWCETWCSGESKSRAKTIDLCNNPLTKEPKLTAAVRIVPEWTEYDNEIKALITKWSDGDNQTTTTEAKPGHSEL